MNNSYNALRNITSFRNTGKSQPISGIELMVDEKNMYFAGNDDGYVMTIDCPYGTQEMANDLLAKAKGFEYQGFTAEQVILPPETELGDGVTVAGVYGMIARRSFKFTPGMTSNVEAPRELEVQHEYKYSSPQQRKTERQIAQTRSLITKTSEEIMLKVEGVDGRVTSLSTSIDGIEANISSLNGSITNITADINGLRTTVSGKIDGSTAQSMIDQSIDEIMLRVDGISGDVSSLRVSLGNVQSEVSGKIDGSTAQSLINQSIDTIELSVSSSSGGSTFTLKAGNTTLSTDTLDLHVKAINIDGTLKANQIQTGSIYVGDLADGSNYATKTYVDNNAGLSASEVNSAIETYIDGTSITAEKLRGRTVELLASSNQSIGNIELAYTTTGYGISINTTYGGIQLNSGGNIYLSAYNGAFITLSDVVSLGGGPLLIGSKMYGSSLPSNPQYGQLFFLLR